MSLANENVWDVICETALAASDSTLSAIPSTTLPIVAGSAIATPAPTTTLAALMAEISSRALPATTASATASVIVAEAANVAVDAPLPTGTEFTWQFIYAHQTNPWDPTYRYAYIFWILMGALLVGYALAHHLRLSGGVIGAYFNRWGMKRHTVRYGPKKSGRSFILPSNSYLLTMGVVMLVIILLCTVGPDKLSEDQGVWQYKRAYDEMIRDVYKAELIRPKHHDHIDKSLWTAGNRFGFMAFAAMPLIVALALKSGPFGFLTPKWFTALHWDKVGTFHRAGGWFVWWIVTIHVVLWTIVLFQLNYDGRPMWFFMLVATRFRGAIASYFFMTAAMVFSIRWVRDRVYEIFYLSHVVFILLSFIFAIVHHHVIGYWIGACLVLWAGDRFTRWSRGAYINGVFGTSRGSRPINPFHDKYQNKANTRLCEIPAGYAQAQILPSKTIRLSIRTHRPMEWAPGQSLLLTLPELSRFQTHPFSIANNDPSEIVLLIKARKGLTLDLYNLVLERTRKTLKPADRRCSILPKSTPVHVKATVDGPMGSAGRVPWHDFSTVLIVCGGSGVTFGMAVCDHLAAVMTQPNYSGATRRVRFVWIVREYAEITWAASALCRFRSRLDKLQLQITIYVTNGEKSTRVNRQRLNTGNDEDDLSDDESTPNYNDFAARYNEIDPETGLSYDEADIRGLTNYAGEDDNHDAKDRRLSRRFQEEGKLRRMLTRQSAAYSLKSLPSMYGGSNTSLHDVPALPADAALRVSTFRHGVYDPYQRHLPMAPIPGSTGTVNHQAPSLAREDSNQTLAPPTFPSPAAQRESINYKALTSRTQDMVLLKDTPAGNEATTTCMSCGHCEGDSLWIDEGDYTATQIMSENARTGRPPLASILKEEMDSAGGRTIIATCGPQGLNTALRNLVSSSIDTQKIRNNDPSGYVTMYSEDFEM